MHVDQILAEWTAPLWAPLGMNGSTALPVFRLCNGNVIRVFFRVGWRKVALTECLRNKQEYRITISVPDAKTQSRTCENKLLCVFLAPERTFYEFFEIDFWEKRSVGRI